MESLATSATALTRRQRVFLAAIAASMVVGGLALAFFVATGVFQKIFMKEVAPKVGTSAPDFALKDIEGKTVRLSGFRGKNPVFLNFWASWCPACREEAPQNEKLHQRLGPKGLKIVAVSINQGSTALADIRKFVKEFKLSFVPLHDSQGEAYHLYGVTGIPTTFLIDRTGKIVAKEVGPKNWTDPSWLNHFETLLN